jgi:hypothetical protein
MPCHSSTKAVSTGRDAETTPQFAAQDTIAENGTNGLTFRTLHLAGMFIRTEYRFV